ncbi:MAG: class I tRNA ligase family protein, partial [Patescibacteria group bacterium]
MPKKFYITTPIYYVNARPHVGHAYTSIAADVLARWQRMNGADVFFLMGTDENSQKNVEAARKAGPVPSPSAPDRDSAKAQVGTTGRGEQADIQKYLDTMSAVWKNTWDTLGITNDDFIRTTEARHKKAVNKFFEAVWKNGDIYRGTYEGWYCTGCEEFKTKDDLESGKCIIHKTEVKKIKEENYFFKLSRYRQQLLDYIKKNPDFIQPKSRRAEITSYIKNFMEDISISRAGAEWGIPVPKIRNPKSEIRNKEGAERQVLYVWFDALINYLTGVGYGATNEKKFKKYWPADLHLVGKDIIKFHCALWPAMLLSAGLPLPKRVFAHGFFTVDGVKMSKTIGNVIDPTEVAARYGNDALRYYIMREIAFGEDGDFSLDGLEARYQGDLANGIGNLVARVLAMTEKYFGGIIPARVRGSAAPTWQSYEINMEDLRLHQALTDVWDLIGYANRFVDSEQPWVLAKIDKKRLARVIYTLLETLRHIGWLVWPFMPETAEKI